MKEVRALDLRMTDRSGKPIPMYHGSNTQIERFDLARVGTAHNTPDDEGGMFFFTTCLDTASWYAKSAAKTHGGEPYIHEVELSFSNPMIVDFEETGVETLFDDIETARERNNDGLVTLNYDDGVIIDQYVAFHPDQIKVLACYKVSPNAKQKRKPKVS